MGESESGRESVLERERGGQAGEKVEREREREREWERERGG